MAAIALLDFSHSDDRSWSGVVPGHLVLKDGTRVVLVSPDHGGTTPDHPIELGFLCRTGVGSQPGPPLTWDHPRRGDVESPYPVQDPYARSLRMRGPS